MRAIETVTLSTPDDFEGWRAAARALAHAQVLPDAILWRIIGETEDLFADPLAKAAQRREERPLAVPRAFVSLAQMAICHRDPERFALLYTLLLRIMAQPAALSDQADPLVRRLEALAKAVRRDIHKMHAFVRFREINADEGPPRFVAWFEPEHHIVRAVASFFVDRFTTMRWSILTPDLSLHWDDGDLQEGPGAARADAPSGDPVEETWKRYYAAIFNPARLKVKAMRKEMPRKYWVNMPETALIGQLIAGAQSRELAMVARSQDHVEEGLREPQALPVSLTSLRDEAALCTRCDLHLCATRTVFGEGPATAPVMFVGEQPGDQEDLAGRAFVGPAGQMLSKALAEAGIDRSLAYVTNAVKHFKFTLRGKRRLHERPNAGEIQKCRWWLERERALIQPRLTVALGASAAHALLGRATSVSSVRGLPQTAFDGGETWVTVHPSFLLRVREEPEAEYARFVADLKAIAARLRALSGEAFDGAEQG